MLEPLARHIRRGWLVIAAAAAASLVLATPVGAGTLSGLSVSVGDARLVNGVYLVVPVTVTCPVISLDANHLIEGETVAVSVQEKVGRTLTSGSASFGYSDGTLFGGGVSGTLLVCDGSPHRYSVNVFPVINQSTGLGVPFKGGKAVASATLDIFIRDRTRFAGDDNFVASGPTSIGIKGECNWPACGELFRSPQAPSLLNQ